MSNRAVLLLPVLTAAVFLLPAHDAHAQATFRIVNVDGPGEGLNDLTPVEPAGGNTERTRGAQRLAALNYALGIWAKRIASSVPITIEAGFDTADPFVCSPTKAILALAGANRLAADFDNAPVKGTWYITALASKLAGKDVDPQNQMIKAIFNGSIDEQGCSFPRRWYYGFDQNPPGQSLDFVTVVNHELTHGLGFATFVDLKTGARVNDRDDIFMTQLFDRALGKKWHQMSDQERAGSSIAPQNLTWAGPAVSNWALSYTSGKDSEGRFLMYTPSELAVGASVVHWDTSLVPPETLKPFYENADHRSTLSRDALTDIGWGPSGVADTDLLLSNERVSVSLTWRNQYDGRTGRGTGVRQLDQYGYFWFDSPGNPEVFVKVLDFGGPSFLVFHSALSDLEYEVVFTVLRTGIAYRYKRTAGSVCGGVDGETVKK